MNMYNVYNIESQLYFCAHVWSKNIGKGREKPLITNECTCGYVVNLSRVRVCVELAAKN